MIVDLENLGTRLSNQNNLIGGVPHFKSKNKNVIFLHTNAFTGTIPTDLGSFDKLARITRHHNQLRSTTPIELEN